MRRLRELIQEGATGFTDEQIQRFDEIMKTFRSSAVSASVAMARENAEGTEPGSVECEQIEIVQNFLEDPVKERISRWKVWNIVSNRGVRGRWTVWMKPVILAMTSSSG